jgi:hypothetical protein
MTRVSWSVLLPGGKKTLHLVQLAEGESRDEFRGRALCAIEARIRKEQGIERAEPIPAGTCWALWEHDGHPIRHFWTNGLGSLVESTGEQYANRTRRIPGLYNEEEARKVLKEKK